MSIDALLSSLDPMSRLKWRVLKQFGTLPSDAEKMTDADYVFCGLNMLMDAGDASPANPDFSMERFFELKEG